jgi:hypothetical protein
LQLDCCFAASLLAASRNAIASTILTSTTIVATIIAATTITPISRLYGNGCRDCSYEQYKS